MKGFGVGMALACLTASVVVAQHEFSAAEIENGGRLYQATCAGCHGTNGDAVNGVNLGSGTFRRATTDDQVTQIILRGIPDTSMPPSTFSEREAGAIVAYLRSLATRGAGSVLVGDPARGKTIFEGKGNCGSCHTPTARTAPALADVVARRRPAELERAIIEPSEDLHADYRFVRVVTRDGATVTGRLMNQSSFSIQMLDSNGQLRGFDRSELREYTILKTSPMPSYRQTLSPQELADLVSFLPMLKGS